MVEQFLNNEPQLLFEYGKLIENYPHLITPLAYAIGIKGSMTSPRNSAAILSELTGLKTLFAEMTRTTDELLTNIFKNEALI
ncbi:TPA: hypothetical protein ACTXW4_000539 [Legionella anisa]